MDKEKNENGREGQQSIQDEDNEKSDSASSYYEPPEDLDYLKYPPKNVTI